MKLNRQAVDKNEQALSISYKAEIGSTAFRVNTGGVKGIFRQSWNDCRDVHIAANCPWKLYLTCKRYPQKAGRLMLLTRPVSGVVRDRLVEDESPLTEKCQAKFCDRHRTTDDMHTLADAASRKMGQEDGAPEGFEMSKRGCVETLSSPDTAGT